MKRIILIILTAAIMLALVSCSGDEAPDGMKAVCDREITGYSFYIPDAWSVGETGAVSAAYIMNFDSALGRSVYTTVSLAEGKRPDDIGEYFRSCIESSAFAGAVEMITDGQTTTLGNSDSAVKYVYKLEYDSQKYSVMQIFASYGERFFTFTFTALDAEKSDGVSYFDYYVEDVGKMTGNVVFYEKASSSGASGNVLISDKRICGFELYVPESWIPYISEEMAGAYVSADDRSNVSLIRLSSSKQMTFEEYYAECKAGLMLSTSSFEEISVGQQATIGNARSAQSFEYRYVYEGRTYRAYQIICQDGSYGYSFLYTALEENYESHLAEVSKIINEVKF